MASGWKLLLHILLEGTFYRSVKYASFLKDLRSWSKPQLFLEHDIVIFASVNVVINSNPGFSPLCDALKIKLIVASGSVGVHY